MFHRVQGRGGTRLSTGGVYAIRRGLKASFQQRDWTRGDILKPLLIHEPILLQLIIQRLACDSETPGRFTFVAACGGERL